MSHHKHHLGRIHAELDAVTCQLIDYIEFAGQEPETPDGEPLPHAMANTLYEVLDEMFDWALDCLMDDGHDPELRRIIGDIKGLQRELKIVTSS